MTVLSNDNPTLIANLRQLSEANPSLANFIRLYGSAEGLGLERAEDGSPVLIVDGLSQDSRKNPLADAQKLLASALGPKAAPTGIWLFGLGSPATLSEAARVLPAVSVYEPDPRVIWAALCARDFSQEFKTRKITLYCPFDKAEGGLTPHPAPLIAHQSSKRRALAAWVGLTGLLGREPTAGVRLLIVPPFYGGSEPMGGFLLRAANKLGLTAKLHGWSDLLSRRAADLRNDPTAGAGDLMGASAREVAGAAKEFAPTLILNLAQAPLDAQGLALLRREAKGALLAFWFVEDFFRFKYVSQVAPAYDLFFHIQDRRLGDAPRLWGLSQCWYLPAAADEEVFKPSECPERFRATLSFSGAGYPNRRAILADLALNGWPKTGRPASEFKIFGSGWEGCPPSLKPHLFEGGRRISTEECARVYNGGQISLNIHSGDGTGFDRPSAFVNPRTFELACCGAAQIVDDRDLLADLFEPGELETVPEPKLLPEAIDKHLANPELGQAMGQKARRTVLSRHLYLHRLQYILERSGLSEKPPTGT
ncbi:MAG: glycosyltransferase [Deltaproteobacteria bacterium]|jgi:spore maturation protein CgeB|nr:glycosyltransferase [Deltaproteobacteria bacterium]